MEMAKPNPQLNHLCNRTDEGIRQLARAHVPILTGTDAPVPGTAYGASVHVELALLVRDGLTPVQALAAATSVPAQAFHLSDRGWIRPGMRADLVLVEGDPTTNILRSEEHTSELQSRLHLVCRLLLEKIDTHPILVQ